MLAWRRRGAARSGELLIEVARLERELADLRQSTALIGEPLEPGGVSEDYSSLAEAAADIMLEVAESGVILYCSPSAVQITGFDPTNFEGTSVFDWVHEDDRERILGTFADAVDHSVNTGPQFRLRHADGSVIWLEIRGRRCHTPDGQFRLVLLLRDVTERRAMREELAARSAQLEVESQGLQRERRTLDAVLAAAPVGVLIIGVTGRVAMLNPMGAAHFSLGDRANWLDRPATEIAAALSGRVLDRRSGEALTSSLLGASKAVVENLEVVVSGNPERTLLLFCRTVPDAVGDELGAVLISRDATGERQLESQLRQAQRMETFSTLAGGVAHDFNNQLAGIVGCAGLMLDRTSNDRDRAGLNTILGAAEHCAGLTQGLLAFARRSPVELKTVDIRDLLDEVEAMLRSTLPESIELTVESAPDLAPAMAAPVELNQVLLNLVTNARDAVRGRGRVWVRATNRTVSADESRDHADRAPGEYVQIEVIDDGPGIDPAHVHHVFDPFFTTKAPGQGTGLGLSIAYGVLQSHHGWIELSDTGGSGAEFRVVIPRSIETPAKSGVTNSTTPLGGTETILVAEDEAIVADVVKAILENLGYEVIVSSDGAEAIDDFAQHGDAISLALVDLRMPRKDGKAVIRAIRAQSPHLPIVLMSGNLAAGEDTGFDGLLHLSKPFRPKQLGDVIRQALDRA